VDATTGANIWVERFDRPLRDIFAVQDEIVQKIVTTVDLEFKLGERGIPQWARTHGTENLEAFDDALRGTWYGWSMTQEGNAKARAMFAKAIELDPKYADAYVGMGRTYFEDVWNGWMDGGLKGTLCGISGHREVPTTSLGTLIRNGAKGYSSG
jgi:adenylate cyclase